MSGAYGKIQVYTGYGKGKTTAALGLAIRALGRHKKVALVFFDKGGDNYGEREILNKLIGENFQYYVTGRKRVNQEDFEFKIEEIDKEEAVKALDIIKSLFNEAVLDLLILDEVNNAINFGLVNLEEFLQIMDAKPKHLELVLTGRSAHPRILERADLVTEMKLIKHYFYQGVGAREGIEY